MRISRSNFSNARKRSNLRSRSQTKGGVRFLSENATLVSAFGLFAGVSLSLTALCAYLSVFDWGLIWIVEYADIIKFSLFGLAAFIASNAIMLTFLAVTNLLKWRLEGDNYSRKLLIIWGSLLLVMFLVAYVDNVSGGSPRAEFAKNVIISFIFLPMAIVALGEIYIAFIRSDFGAVCFLFLWLMCAATEFGSTLGIYIRDISPRLASVVLNRDAGSLEFNGVKIIMFLSHHLIMLDTRGIIVIPASIVQQLTYSK